VKWLAVYEYCPRAWPVFGKLASERVLYGVAPSCQSRAGVLRLLISQKIFLSVLVWTVISILISLSAGVEVLVTLVLIGLLVARELTDGFLTKDLRDKMDMFIYAGLILFVIVVVRRVWIILT
jgi:hypothetical protein